MDALIQDLASHPKIKAAIDDVRAAERKATVERIRARLLAGALIPSGIEEPYLAGIAEARNSLLVILDEEGAS